MRGAGTTTSRPATTITRQDGPNVRPDSATGDWSCVLESAEYPNPFSSADCSACCADNECVYGNSISTSTVYRTYNGVANTRIATATCGCARCGMTTQRVPTTTTASGITTTTTTPPPCSSLTGADEAMMQMYTSYSYPSWRDYCGSSERPDCIVDGDVCRDADDSEAEASASGGAIAGGVVGGLVAVAMIAAVVVVYLRRSAAGAGAGAGAVQIRDATSYDNPAYDTTAAGGPAVNAFSMSSTAVDDAYETPHTQTAMPAVPTALAGPSSEEEEGGGYLTVEGSGDGNDFEA